MSSNEAGMDRCNMSSKFNCRWKLWKQDYYFSDHFFTPIDPHWSSRSFIFQKDEINITWKTLLDIKDEADDERILSIEMENGKLLTDNIQVSGIVTVSSSRHANYIEKKLPPSFLPRSTGIKHAIWRFDIPFPKYGEIEKTTFFNIQVFLTLVNFEGKIPLDQIPPVALAKDFLTLFKSKSLTDVVLVAENQEFQAHKAVLSARSPVFAAMFSSEMKENLENRVEIKDFSPLILEKFLKFVYSGCYESSEEVLQEMFVIGEKYIVEDLKTVAMLDLCKFITVETVDKRLAFAKQFNHRELRNLCYDFIKDNCTKLQEM